MLLFQIQAGGKVFEVYDLTPAEGYSSLNGILQLPDIARPVIIPQGIKDRARNTLDLLIILLAIFS